MLKPIQLEYKENAKFGGRTKEQTEEYNKYQLEGFELYNACNFDKELKRNINSYIENYTKFFIDNTNVITVSPMKKLYPIGYYEHCKKHKILVDHENKCLLLMN
ncbi:hypothetical protein H9L25_00725 [Terrisporobacter mayombei]|nr:hypothetical protein [Terrisporobacter mayombei]